MAKGQNPDLIEQLEQSLTNFDGGEHDVSKSVTLLSVAVVQILKDLGRLSKEDFEVLEGRLEKIKKLRELIKGFVENLSSRGNSLAELRNSIPDNYAEDQQFGSLEFLSEGQEGVRKSISVLIELINFLDILNDPLQHLEESLSTLKDEENKETLGEKTEKLYEARRKLGELESSLRQFLICLHKGQRNVERIHSGTTFLYNRSKEILRVEDEEENIFRALFGRSGPREKKDFVFHENLPISTVFDDVFTEGLKISRENESANGKKVVEEDDKGTDEKPKLTEYEKFFIKISNALPHIQAFRDKTFHNKDESLEMLDSLFGEYSGIEDSYLDLMDEYREEEREEREFVFKSSLEEEEKKRERTKMFSGKGANKFQKRFHKLLSGKIEDSDIFNDADVEKHVGDEKLCVLRTKAYKVLDIIFDKLIDGGKDVQAEYEKFLEACTDYIKYYDKKFGYKPKQKNKLGEKKFTYHYSVQKDQHDKVAGLGEIQLDKAPSRSVGKSIDEVKQKIEDICTLQDILGGFLDMFPGKDNSKNNLLILGPYGTGKTALIRELAYDDSIATIQVQASDLLSMWYGVAEQNFKKLFQFAHKLSKDTGKKVFIMVDEFDQLSQMSNSSGGNQKDAFQKELQVLLDGVQEFEGVHLIGLSNEPQKFPPALIRRMDTVVTERLTNEEKAELISSRYSDIPMSEDLGSFLEQFSINIDMKKIEDRLALWCALHKDVVYGSLSQREQIEKLWEYVTEVGHEITIEDIEDNDGFATNSKISSMRDEQKELYRYVGGSTPKILASICEKAYSICLQKYMDKHGEKHMKTLNTKLNRYKTQKAKVKLLADQGISVAFEDMLEAGREIFKNPTILSQIEVNAEFYGYMRSLGLVSGVFADPEDTQK